MARIVVTSDLHLGITTEDELRAMVERIAAEQPDLTVLAGDIGEGLENVRACLGMFKALPGQVAVLMGNHDLWTERSDSQELWDKLLPEAVREAGMIWLEDSVWRGGEADGVAVAGSMCWYDYSAVDPAVPPHDAAWFAEYKGQYNPDAYFINWQWSDQEAAQALGDALAQRLQTLEDDATVRAVMVVTHVPLFRVQMFYKADDLRWGTGSAFFGNMTLGDRLLTMRKLRRVISGHTHVGREGVVDRPGLAPLPVWVLPSDYHKPAYLVVETSELLT
jgi:predicted phosphohydrolase